MFIRELIYSYVLAASYSAMMFSTGVTACRLWHGPTMKPVPSAPSVGHQPASPLLRTSSGVPKGSVSWLSTAAVKAQAARRTPP